MKKTVNKSLSETLWYERPAENWNEALPVGNGRMGGMVFGRLENELIELNEDSIWSGGFRKRNNPLAKENLPKIRELIIAGKIKEAEKLCEEAFYATSETQRRYQPLGSLHIIQDSAEKYSGYQRFLDLEDPFCFTGWTSGGTGYSRVVFASYPDDVIAVYFTANEGGRISFSAYLDGRDDCFDRNEAYDGSTLLFTVTDGIPFSAAVSVSAKGGKAYTEANRIRVEEADEALLVIACQTAFRTGDYEKLAVSQAKAALRRGIESLTERHLIDYQSLYERCSLSLEDNSGGNSELPTDERLKLFREGGNDNKLIEMYFNFSRYLMISGSRKGSLPLNLQGIWNKDMDPAWGSKYTVNINTEMNYWGAEIQNLSECHMPLFDHIERMRENGRVTAREMYGCKGTVCHHNTDIWGDTAPQDRWMPATLWPMGMAWLCLHIWEHYKFTGDAAFLAEKFDTICEAAEFFEDFLIEDEKGRMVTCPSVSPENTYIKGKEQGCLCIAPSMDSQILFELFTAVVEGAKVVEKENETDIYPFDKEFVSRIEKLRKLLPMPRRGKHAQVMEWSEDYDEAEPGHRHISQLFALYPADIISVRKTPSLSKAAETTIKRRLSHGGGHTGWSRAWIINMWARLKNGEKVSENIRALLSSSTSINMFDMHPPFQIDGNFGGGAGIAEALIQSISGEIELLPACPLEWENGELCGVMARGGFELSFSWRGGAVKKLAIFSKRGNECRIVNGKSVKSGRKAVKSEIKNDVLIFKTEAGKKYTVEL